jgi:2-polyprenyl-3-methyl-5-hydroxy-6-metoxy-1,4-benzoquinol methylase
MDEQSRLDSIAPKYSASVLLGINELYHLAIRDTMIPASGGNRALEIGCGGGSWTPVLCDKYKTVDVVDGSQKLLSDLVSKCKADNLTVHHCLVEQLASESVDRWDHAFMTFLMEHLLEPWAVLSQVRPLIAVGGSLFIAVPNANSLHRVIAQRMGLIEDTTELSDNDHQVGHRRVYTRELLLEHLTQAGFSVEQEWSIGLKPLTLGQMKELPDAVGVELANCGDLAPDYCAYLGLRAVVVEP